MKKETKLLAVVLLLLLLLFTVSCSGNSISMDEYNESYSFIVKELADKTNLITLELIDILFPYVESSEYSHQDMIHYFSSLNETIDESLITLYALGPQLDDQKISKNQSKFEDSLLSIQLEIKKFLEKDSVDVVHPNTYTVMQDYYKLMRDVSEYYLTLSKSLNEIDARLTELGYPRNDEITAIRNDNASRFDYLILALGGYSSALQEFSGMQVYPRAPQLVFFDNDFYHEYELGSGVLVEMKDFIIKHKELYENDNDDFNNQIDVQLAQIDNYLAERAKFPYDFFTGSDYLTDQVFTGEKRLISYSNYGKILDYPEDSEYAQLIESADTVTFMFFLLDHKSILEIENGGE